MNIINNKILITGGSSGIGLALALKLSNLGNQVIITGRDRSKLYQISKQHNLFTFCCDLNQSQDLNQLVRQVKEEHSDINILINNAGIQHNYSFLDEVPFSLIDEEIGVNLSAMIKLCASFTPLLIGTREAAIVNISSSLAVSPKRSAPVYCATKAGVHTFTKALRYQLDQSNVKVFEVVPPLVDTPMTASNHKNKITADELAEEFVDGFEKDIYEMRIGKAKLLKIIHRISPALADTILKNN